MCNYFTENFEEFGSFFDQGPMILTFYAFPHISVEDLNTPTWVLYFETSFWTIVGEVQKITELDTALFVEQRNQLVKDNNFIIHLN